MKIINGIYASAKIFTDNIDDYAIAQIKMLCDNEASTGSTIRIMPDVHPGKIGTIGLTMTVGKQILPSIVGIDIGCGMNITKLKCKKIGFQKLDTVIREHIPAGANIRKYAHRFAETFDFSRLKCIAGINVNKATLSLGTLGGGNHFIEVDKSDDNELYMVIHSGSRHLGKEVTEYYLKKGQELLKEKGKNISYELTYLEGDLMSDYIEDIHIVQEFALLNRKIIADELVKGMKWKTIEELQCVHNYIDDSGIIRKGAISARENEKLIIPINMRDGIILATGKGTSDWNFSAPHGSGRILKRTDVKSNYTVSSFKSSMKGIYSSCISANTLDEAPFAYRGIDEIKSAIEPTAVINKIIKPVYNFKAQ